MKKTKISSFSIALLLFIAVFGITNIPANYASLGNNAIGWFILLGLYFIPLALIIGELSSQNVESKSGMYGWIQTGLNDKWAYIGSWSYFVVNIFYLPMIASRIPVLFSWTFNTNTYDLHEIVVKGGDVPGVISATDDKSMFLLLTFIALAIALVLGVFFEKFFTTSAKIIGWLSLGVTLLFILMSIFGVIMTDSSIANEITIQSTIPTLDATALSTFAWILFAIAGIETIGSYTPYVDKAHKKIPRAALVAAILVIGAYVIGFISMGFILKPEQVPMDSFENMIPIMYAQVGDIWGLGGIFLRIITFIYLIITTTAVVLWLTATVKSLFEDFPKGVISEKIIRYKINDIPVFGLLITLIMVVILLIISNSGSSENIYLTMYDMTTIAVLLPYLLIGFSFIVFSLKKDVKFNVLKNKTIAFVLGVIIFVVTLIAMIFSIFDLTITDKSEFYGWALLSGGGLIYFIAIGLSIYLIKTNKILGYIITCLLFLFPFLFII